MQSTSGFIYIVLHKLAIPLDIRNICVFLAPVFASFTAIAAYLLTTEVTKKHGAGLLAALFIGLAPSYMSRSVAGSYDNEGVSIFALVFSFYVFLKACNTGSILWSVGSSLSYFYMVASWGGYSFIINIIPIFVLFSLITLKPEEEGKFAKIITAYNIFYILGTLLAMQIPFVQFLALTSSEHMASHGVFIIVQFYQLSQFIKKYIGQERLDLLFRYAIIGLSIALGAAFILLLLLGQTKWSGRSMTLLDPTYAKKYIPIVASVSEHQATTWSSYFFDIHFAIFFAPVGLYYIYRNREHNIVFIGIYAVLSVYFASVMIRLLLVFAPAACICAAIGISWLYEKCIESFSLGWSDILAIFKSDKTKEEKVVKGKKGKKRLPWYVAIALVFLISWMISTFVYHGVMSGA
jgi:dolichyl-diphosphooligosaccharide--protein glycosyltransferase